MKSRRRKYEETHPWLSFSFDMTRLSAFVWMNLGEARSKCEHIAGVPLQPGVAAEMHKVYLVKGVLGSSAIEGNTLNEEEARQYIEGELEPPPSQEYLAREVENIERAINLVAARTLNSEGTEITVENVKEYNEIILDGLELEPEVVPGEIRQHSVVAGRYRGAPPEDCEYLLERMCEWLNQPEFCPDDDDRPVYGILRAILAHLYLTWIHPFGDGNGRTARLIEYQVLVAAGLPSPAPHVLSNHYNLTRGEYYRRLDRVSKNGGDVGPFVEYALQGFVDGLKEQLEWIKVQQWTISWRDYVYSTFRDKESEVDNRRRHLILDLTQEIDPVPLTRIRKISARVAEHYAGLSRKTLRRDLRVLEDMSLAEVKDGSARAMTENILAFLPDRREL